MSKQYGVFVVLVAVLLAAMPLNAADFACKYNGTGQARPFFELTDEEQNYVTNVESISIVGVTTPLHACLAARLEADGFSVDSSDSEVIIRIRKNNKKKDKSTWKYFQELAGERKLAPYYYHISVNIAADKPALMDWSLYPFESEIDTNLTADEEARAMVGEFYPIVTAALGRFDALDFALNDGDKAARSSAILWIGLIENPVSQPLLKARLKVEKNRKLRKQIRGVLKKWGKPRPTPDELMEEFLERVWLN